MLPVSGPSASQVQDAPNSPRMSGIQIVDLNDTVARRLLAGQYLSLFSETLGSTPQTNYVVGPGDVIEVSLWEAPPATLFGSAALDSRSVPATSRVTTFPEQMVSNTGYISIPFAGQISVAGQTLQQIEEKIVRQLKDKANQPQVLVRMLRNNTANVTVVGEVASSVRVPLTPRGERLMDALAAAGGVRQPVNKMTLQITRGSSVHALPLETIIRDPKQNILLQPGDVITAIHQPLSYTILGATGKNEEVNFEAQGISLSQALARAGGLQDARSDAQGVFIFRFEAADALEWPSKPLATTPDGKVAVIYRANLKDPASFFTAQNFPVKNRDVLYVSNAPAAELQKFLNLVTSVAYPLLNVILLAK